MVKIKYNYNINTFSVVFDNIIQEQNKNIFIYHVLTKTDTLTIKIDTIDTIKK